MLVLQQLSLVSSIATISDGAILHWHLLKLFSIWIRVMYLSYSIYLLRCFASIYRQFAASREPVMKSGCMQVARGSTLNREVGEVSLDRFRKTN